MLATLAVVAGVVLGACRAESASPSSAVSSGVSSTATVAASAEATPPETPFGDLASLRSLLEDGGFRAEVTSETASLVAGEGVRVVLELDVLNPQSFRAATLEIAPLSVLDTDPAAQPAVNLVLSLFDQWSPTAATSTRDALARRGTTTAREDAEQTVSDGFRLRIAFAYGSPNPADDYFRATLRRP